jgi:AcrR family transcriptional regulator
MARMLKRMLKAGRRRIKAGLTDLRTWRLYMAGRELLAERDIDDIKVVELTSMASMSVGAFYGRFDTKAAFLSFLIRERLRHAGDAAVESLSLATMGSAPLQCRVAKIAKHQLKAMHGPMGGVVRACIKSGGKDLGELRVYRDTVARQAVALLCSELGTSMEHDVRAAVQMLHAALIDMLVHEGGALRRGRRRTLEALTQTMQGYLGLDVMKADKDPLKGDVVIEMDEELGPTPVEREALQVLIEREVARKSAPISAAEPKPASRPNPTARTDTRRLRARLV